MFDWFLNSIHASCFKRLYGISVRAVETVYGNILNKTEYWAVIKFLSLKNLHKWSVKRCQWCMVRKDYHMTLSSDRRGNKNDSHESPGWPKKNCPSVTTELMVKCSSAAAIVEILKWRLHLSHWMMFALVLDRTCRRS